MRIFLSYVLPLLLPTLVFLGWAWLMRHQRAKGGHEWWQEGPWFWLVVAGFVLMLGVLGVTAFWDTGRPGQTYVPPVLENGKVVPGHFK